MNIGDKVMAYCKYCLKEHSGKIKEIQPPMQGETIIIVALDMDNTELRCTLKEITFNLKINDEEL